MEPYHHGSGPPRSGMGTIGIVIVILAISVLMGFVLISAIAESGSGGNGEPGQIVCDVQGSVAGLVKDYNPPLVPADRKVEDITMNLFVTAGSCHEKTYWDDIGFNLVGPDTSIPQDYALIGEGYVEISVRALDASNHVVQSKTFTVKTANFEPEKRFTEPLLFKNLVKGQTYTMGVYHQWNGGTSPIFTKSITVQ